MEDTNIITTSGDTSTLPTTIKGIASTMPEGSLLMTSALTNEPINTTDVSPSATVTSNTVPTSTMEDTNIITTSGGTHTLPTTMIKGTTSTMPEGSYLTTSATSMNEPTSTTESLDKDIDHFTTRDQTETGVVPGKENDVSVVIVDSKLAITLSVTNLAMFIVLAVVVLVHILVHCVHKRQTKESKSAKVELTKMKELIAKTTSPMHTLNTYASPVHNRYCSEEKVDMM